MRRTLLILPLLVAACATPREQCISDVTRELRVMTELVNETQANIQRGYAVAETQEVRTIRSTCTGENEDGSTFTFPCEETETIDRQVPVAIDLNAEQAKLTSLLERQSQLQRASDAAVQQCIAIHPE